MNVTKRLRSELMSLMMAGEPSITAFPEADNMFVWRAKIQGGADTVYEGFTYSLVLEFPKNYPFEPPLVRFESACFHPNVSEAGDICLDILKEKWTASYDVRTILISIQSLLAEPNNDSPLNNRAARLWANRDEYVRVLREVNQRQYAAAQ